MGIILDEHQKEKYDFVRTTLTNLLRQALHNDHYTATYYVNPNGTEWVDVSFDSEYAIKKINVTGESLIAITKEVVRNFI